MRSRTSKRFHTPALWITQGYADKCTFCLHRVEKGRQPACVSLCPTIALTFGDLADADSEISQVLQKRKFKSSKAEVSLLVPCIAPYL